MGVRDASEVLQSAQNQWGMSENNLEFEKKISPPTGGEIESQSYTIKSHWFIIVFNVMLRGQLND